MGKLKLMFWASRPFALPWMAANSLLGVALAGFSWWAWFLAFVITSLVLVASHYINNWRDYVKGFDDIEKGSQEKSYTSASKLLPAGLLSEFDMIAGIITMLGLSVILMVFFVPSRLDVWSLYGLGVLMALTYTDFWKPKGLGEIPLFLAHGFGVTTFSYALVKPLTAEAIAAGVIVGLLAALVYTLDQLPDVETDFGKKSKDIAYMMFHAETKPSSYIWFTASSVSVLLVMFVLLGWLPRGTLIGLAALPAFHVTGVVIDYDYNRGVLLGLVSIWLFPILSAIGVLFS